MISINKNIVQLAILYFLVVLTIVFRYSVESTGYTSPDSKFYLKTASNVLDGKGYISPNIYPFDDEAPQQFYGIWPIGYPTFIALISYCTSLDVYVASKIVNLIFLALTFTLLYSWYGKNSLLPACYFCSFNMLEIYSYTWSEGSFIFFILLLLYALEKILISDRVIFYSFLIVSSLVFSVLLRYSGLIYFFYLASLIVFLLLKKKHIQKVRPILLALAISTLLSTTYLLINYFYTDSLFGNCARIFPTMETWHSFIQLFIKGLTNELLLIRSFYWTWDVLLLITIPPQIYLYYMLNINHSLKTNELKNNNIKIMLSAGLFYLVFIFVLRKISPFDAFDNRILAPFSVPIYLSLLFKINKNITVGKKTNLKIIIIAFSLFSIVMNLPKKHLLELLNII